MKVKVYDVKKRVVGVRVASSLHYELDMSNNMSKHVIGFVTIKGKKTFVEVKPTTGVAYVIPNGAMKVYTNIGGNPVKDYGLGVDTPA